MDFGLMTEPQLGATYEEIRRTAKTAEDIGLSVYARSDHYLFPRFDDPHATDAFATLAGLARDTDRIRLAVLVSPITFRHPGVIAKTAATIDEMSGGRFVLGVGTGWMEEEHSQFGLPFWTQGERFERFEEALAYLRKAFGPDDEEFEGRFYTLGSAGVRPKPTGELPIIVGGSGKRRTPRLAGTFADEYNVFADTPEGIRDKVAVMRQAAADQGRDPGSITISVMGGAVTGSDEASYQSNLERVAAADPFGRSPDELESRLADRGLPVGPGPQAREAVAALSDAGVQRYYLQHFGPFEADLIEDMFEALRV
jgi:F420-dependent oxidoreductase-like protein